MPNLRREWSPDYNLTALLVLIGLDLFVVRPLAPQGTAARPLVIFLYTLAMIAGVRAVAPGRVAKFLLTAAVIANLVVSWLHLSLGRDSLATWDAAFSVVGCTGLGIAVLVQVFRQGPITSHRIQGAVVVYLLIGVSFGFLYELMDRVVENSFSFSTAIMQSHDAHLRFQFRYFSFVTLTTVGFGDITAIHPLARSAVILEALIGQLYPTILLARLVSLELHDRKVGDSAGGMR